ncbi:MAG: hypothetical protein C4527_03640 [Candidatus Omnitrophota bacterium]|nr:MAG: hypothetical protein C4527_03640 [Candidatus Omnitrophota bacterium]
MIKRFSSFYIALVLIVSFSIALGSLMQIGLLYEKEEIEKSVPALFFAAKLETGLDQPVQDEIAALVMEIEGIAAAQTEHPIPEWRGEPDQKTAWQEMWKAYLSPIVYATAELRLSTIDHAAQIADQIRDLTGVTSVIWDQSGYQDISANLIILQKKEFFFTGYFLLYLIVIVGGLLASFPIRFRRKYVVLTGFKGAGSQISPEGVWIRLVLTHIILSVILYVLFFTVGYLFFPFSVNTLRFYDLFIMLLEGAIVVAGLVAAVCLVGWWFSTESIEELAVTRRPISE